MPLPEAFRKHARDPNFWAAFRGENGMGADGPRPDLEAAPIDLTLDSNTGLRVSFEWGGTKTTILVRIDGGNWTQLVTNQDGGHHMPHAIRWQEADLIGRALALTDPELPHPGVPFLLLQPFIVSLDVENHATKYPLTAAAWRSLGLFSERRIVGMARGRPDHLAGYVWAHREPEGWVVEEPGDFAERMLEKLRYPPVYSLRTHGNPHFPFREWNAFLAAAENVYAAHSRPRAFSTNRDAGALAESVVTNRDLTAAAALGERLARQGEVNRAVPEHLRSGDAARVAWVLELLRGERRGELIRVLCPTDVPPPQATQRLWLDVAFAGLPHVHSVVLPALREHSLGEGEFIGTSGLGDLVPATDPPLTDMVWLDVTDLDEAVRVIRQAMRDRPGAYPAYLHLVDPTITDGPQLRLIPLD
jgi:hypothetical protein